MLNLGRVGYTILQNQIDKITTRNIDKVFEKVNGYT